MCLAVPMKVINTEDLIAHCEYRDIKRSVSLMMLPGQIVEPGQYVMVQLGYAMQIVSEAEAQKSWEMMDEIMLKLDDADF